MTRPDPTQLLITAKEFDQLFSGPQSIRKFGENQQTSFQIIPLTNRHMAW